MVKALVDNRKKNILMFSSAAVFAFYSSVLFPLVIHTGLLTVSGLVNI